MYDEFLICLHCDSQKHWKMNEKEIRETSECLSFQTLFFLSVCCSHGLFSTFNASLFFTFIFYLVCTMTHPSLPQPQHCPPTFDAYLILDSHKTTFLSYSCIQISRLSDILFVLNVLTSRFSPITHGSMISRRMDAEWRKVQNSNKVYYLASCKMTQNVGAAVTFLLKFHHCVEAIFLIFRVCLEVRGPG